MQQYKCLKRNRFSFKEYELLPIREKDIFLIMDWRNAQLSVLRQKNPLTKQEQQRYFDQVVRPSLDIANPSQILFSFLKHDVCIGYGGIVHISWEDKRGEVSFLLKPDRVADKQCYREDFLAYLDLLKEAAYTDLQFNRLSGETYDIRPFHVSIMEEAGFVLEGRMIQHIFLNDRYVDSLIHGHLREFGKQYRQTGTSETHDLAKGESKPLLVQKNRLGVFISSVSRKIPMVNAVKKAAGMLSSVTPINCGDADPNCLGRHFTDGFWQMPQLSALSADAVLSYCLDNGITSVIPSRDGELLFYSSLKFRLAQHGINVMVSDEDPLHNCLDKLRFAQLLRSQGFPVIATAEDPDAIESGKLVVKERFGSGAKGMAIDIGHAEALEFSKTLAAPLFQPFIAGHEFSVDLYVDQSGECLGAVVRRRELIIDGESQVTTTVRHPRLEAMCSQIAESLVLYGHCVFQAIEDSTGNLHIIECNPRFGGASTLSERAGLTSFLWFFCEGLGIDPRAYPFIRSQKELRQVRYPCDALFELE